MISANRAANGFHRNLTCRAAALFLLFSPGVASALDIVFEPSNYGQNIVTASNMVTSVANQATQIQNQVRNLELLPGASNASMQNNLTGQLGQINSVLGSAQGINYQMGAINNQYQAL